MVRGSRPHTPPPEPPQSFLTVPSCLRSGRLRRLHRGHQRRPWIRTVRDQRAAVSGMPTRSPPAATVPHLVFPRGRTHIGAPQRI